MKRNTIYILIGIALIAAFILFMYKKNKPAEDGSDNEGTLDKISGDALAENDTASDVNVNKFFDNAEIQETA